MKQLPLIASTLFMQPWNILPSAHAELALLFRNYTTSNLPEALQGSGQLESGVTFDADPVSGITLISLDGIVCKRAPEIMCGPRLVDLAMLDLLLADALVDETTRTVVLYLNTPGGCGIGLHETSALIQELRAAGKRVVAYVDYLCASAGYWLAASCDEIVCAPSSQVGSVGTYVAALDDTEAWKMEGYKLKIFKDGDYKAMGHPGKEWTKEEEEFLESRKVTWAAEFKNHIRTMRPDLQESSMQGQTFDAYIAPDGLIDRLANSITDALTWELELLADT